MSTPNANMTGAVPSPASKKVGSASVSTPMNQYPSPAPRSIPSPAALRKDPAAKTPINHPTGSSQGARTVGTTPMIASRSQQGSTASPAAGLLAGLTPTGLGVDLGTPIGPLGASMAISMSELGLTASGGVRRNEDEERRVKMRKIIKSIGKVRGRVGEDGIARASRRVGFANDIDVEKLSVEERARRVGNRTISIAGNTTVIDIDLKNHKPRNVQVLFSTELAGGAGQSERAATILLERLKSSHDESIGTSLDAFSNDLAYLARLDHLSSSRISCFDALSGIYRSLKRLEQLELETVKKDHAHLTAESVEAYVLNQKSGQPRMHEDGRLGLSIQYWTPSQQTWRQNKTTRHGTASNRIIIETARCQAGLYPPIRISEGWLSDSSEIEASDDLRTTAIPWQDPPPTFLSPDVDSATDDPVQTLPDVRFVAKLDPPVILPWQIAANTYSALGATVPPLLQMPSYLSLLLGLPTNAPSGHSAVQEVPSLRSGPGEERTFKEVRHAYKLNIVKHDVGFTMDELPFSHPRQLIEILPTLRQWACIGRLLHRVFENPHAEGVKLHQVTLSDLLAGNIDSNAPLPVELTLALNPVPTLSLAFPRAAGLCCLEVQVSENAKISVAGDISDVPNAGPALEIVQDLSLWTEWILSHSVSAK